MKIKTDNLSNETCMKLGLYIIYNIICTELFCFFFLFKFKGYLVFIVLWKFSLPLWEISDKYSHNRTDVMDGIGCTLNTP